MSGIAAQGHDLKVLGRAMRCWPGGLAEQIKAVAEIMAGARRPLAMADLEARFSGRGCWRERLMR